jgi:hypothetical protein
MMGLHSPLFRAFVMAVGIHLVLFIGVFLARYPFSKPPHPPKEEKTAISFHPFHPILPKKAPKTLTVTPPKKVPKKGLLPDTAPLKTPILDVNQTQSPIMQPPMTAPIVPMGRVAGLIKRHYGEIFEELSPQEQAYILENIVTIHRIDRHVGNALLAEKEANLFHDGDSNYVEMYLYPDGTVADITIIDEENHPALTQLTMETVERSYAQYPRPNQKTLIRLHTRILRAK